MPTELQQVQPEPWPSGYGEAVAMLDVALDLLANRYGLRLFEGADNLGDYHAAAIRLPSGRMIGLLRHVVRRTRVSKCTPTFRTMLRRRWASCCVPQISRRAS
jgi:hypothetical protein